MSTRWRIFLAAVVLVVLPLSGTSWVLRQRVTRQYEREFTRRAHGQLTAAISSLQSRGHRIAGTLQGIVEAMADDNRLRWAIVDERIDQKPYLRDAAGHAMKLGGLDLLQLQDADGIILSSGHYRNEFDRREPELPALLAQASWSRAFTMSGGLALVRDQLPDAGVLALEVVVPFTLGNRPFTLVGGEQLTFPDLANLGVDQTDLDLVTATGPLGDDVWYRQHLPAFQAWSDTPALATALTAAGFLVRTETVPLIDGGELLAATLVARVSTAPLKRTLRELELTLTVALVVALAGAFLLAAWLSARLSRPLSDLAAAAARVDLDDPAADFPADRRDEVGQLSRVLGAMVARLREDARRLADAEHRATLGEVARQVNHDLRNGITPVRNVLRHLGETARQEPDRLAEVFQGREATLTDSLAFLEELAGRYARLAPSPRQRRCDVAAIARELAQTLPEATVVADQDAPAVLIDPLSLRRILGNLLRNAQEALPPGGGRIIVKVGGMDDPDLGRQCVLAIDDDGCGMPPEVQARIFEDFFTTKEGGTGLGLSNVRRLAGDAGGRLHVDSDPDRGTTITLTFPAAEADA